MRILFSIIFVFFGAFVASADGEENPAMPVSAPLTVTVSGTVSDSQTGETLVGVQVELEGTTQKTYTDFDGNFAFENVAPGEYNISASYISYEQKKIEKQTIDIFSSSLKVALTPVN